MFILPLFAIALSMMPLVPVYTGAKTGQKAKHAFIFHLCAFFGIMLLMLLLPLGGFVSAAGDATATAAATTGIGDGLKYIGAALSTGLASIGACSEDPKAFGKAMIFVVLGEGIAIYGLVISFLILFAA